MITADDLANIPEFDDLDRADLEWLAGYFELHEFEDDVQVFPFMAPAEHFMVVLEGGIRIQRYVNGQFRFFSEVPKGRITGMLPYSRMQVYEAVGHSIGPTRIAMMHKDHFPEVLYRLPILGQRLVALMSDRVRRATQADQELDKLLALGKMSAGLAHELNNPAAAARRAAADLDTLIKELPETVSRLLAHGLTPEAVIPAARACAMHREHAPASALERADLEEELLDWLEDRNVDKAWEIAPEMAECGITVSDLEESTGGLDPSALSDVISWMWQSTTASRLISEVHDASSRISDLVRSVKTYSHMDRSTAQQPVRLTEGIESTLTMLGHKLRQKSIQVENLLPEDLPAASGFPGELNQVWTNILDNAIDATPEGGRIRISASTFADRIDVCIEDSGSGIPEDVLPHIFEPFYTTKDVGQGTGLGLDIVHRVVVEQHRGQILVDSEPGKTRFRIQLPRA